jgi:transcriptional regulator with XRE-family HTH domain
MKVSVCTYDAADIMAGRPTNRPAPTFGARLAALRKERGWTQPQLAKMLGISPAMLAYYERKATNPTADFVKKAAGVLNTSVDDLLDHAAKPLRKSGPPSQLEHRLQAIRQLPREKQKLVLQFLDTFLRDAQQNKGS